MTKELNITIKNKLTFKSKDNKIIDVFVLLEADDLAVNFYYSHEENENEADYLMGDIVDNYELCFIFEGVEYYSDRLNIEALYKFANSF